MPATWRDSYGAELRDGGVRFALMAPGCKSVMLVLEGEVAAEYPMQPDGVGRFTCFVAGLAAGSRYRYRPDDADAAYPDPASRFQPDGPHGPSEVVDSSAFAWTDAAHAGVQLDGQVIYEMHVGTFTQEGTFSSATRELHHLSAMGITLIELMPIADFPGRFGWGYDGVNLFAPSRLYGTPTDLKAFVDRAHSLGIGIIHDVVYNHLGPDGNYLPRFYDRFFSDERNDWGQCINFDGEGAAATRAFYLANAAYWIDEFHFDGLRLDATQDIHDTSETHVIAELIASARQAGGKRSVVIVAENEPQKTDYVRSRSAGGFDCDALWNDDFHHAATVAATGRNEAYYSDTLGRPQELISALKWGYLYQGQYYAWQKQPRGTPALDVSAKRFVVYLQNHDQIANSARGLRLHALTSPGRARALKALLLLAPGTPMLFQGEEFDASSPFFYFADHQGELARLVREGRADFLKQFPSISSEESRRALRDPGSPETFNASKLRPEERTRHEHAVALVTELLALRKGHAAFRAQSADRMHGAVLGDEAFALRFMTDDGNDRLVLVNLGRDLDLIHAPEPLLAPPFQHDWRVVLSTEEPRFGGSGQAPLDAVPYLRAPGHAALVLAPFPRPSSVAEKKV
jgi:maltooligosyltrehalose trehalohydrolase